MGLFSGIGKALGGIAKSVVGSAVGSVGGALGSAAGSAIAGSLFGDPAEDSRKGVAAANAATIASTKEQMAFQKEMYGSRYQMQVNDMKLAGLNPMLSYNAGPPGAPPGASTIVRDEATPSVNTAMANRRLNAEIQSIEAAAEASRATANNQNAQAAVQAVMIPKIQADTSTSLASASNLNQLTENAKYQYNVLMSEFDRNIASADLSRSQSDQIKAALPYIADLSRAELNQRLASFGLTQQQINSVQQDIYIASLSVKRLQNLEGAQHSWYMENISPFLPDVLQSSNSAASVKRSFR